jgi:hypothetical protein
MKYIYTALILTLLFVGRSNAQTGRGVSGQLIDSTKQSLPGSTVKLKTDLGDSTTIATDIDGKFNFSNIKGSKITLYISSFGFEGIIKHYTFSPTDNSAFVIPPITLKTEIRQLKEVVIVGVNPIKFKEDTIDYKIAAYPVRENAPVEDVLKKMPGVDVDNNGNVTAQGKTITKIRINGKDFMGGDVQSATKNIPADILESVQVIDDYGDQANLTGVRTGEPNKILNFTIRNDKNYGYSLQASAGAGKDALPAAPNITNENRYIGSVNFFNFKGNRQVTVLGNINNINSNTFNFGGGGGNNGGGNNGGGNNGGGNNGGGGGGQRGGGPRGGGNGGLASVKDGITIARAIGTNYRDQWGKDISVYGSYSFSDNSTFTSSNTFRKNNGANTTNNNQTTANDNPINHRFNFNMEWKPDTINYLKVSPYFNYGSTNSTSFEDVLYQTNGTTTRAYTTSIRSNSTSPSFGGNVLFNHRFAKRGRNFSLFFNVNTSQSKSASNPIVNPTIGASNVPLNQVINTNNHTTTLGGNISYLEPIGAISYLELSYNYNHSFTSNDKETDSLDISNTLKNVPKLSNYYTYTFVTNRIGLNYRVIDIKYNYTIGLGVQPSVLDGRNITNSINTHVSQFNYVPAARFIYNFSRNESLSINYNGSSTQPSFNQLQPVVDLSSASYPVQGNPNLNQQFTNNVFLRYNSFGIESGNILFLNASYNQISDYVATRTTTFATLTPAAKAAHPEYTDFSNATLTRYQNGANYTAGSFGGFLSKPWDERKYTISVNANVNFAKYPSYVDNVDANGVSSATLENIAKTLTFSPGLRFRLDLRDVIDAQASYNYSISKTDNSLTGISAVSQNTNIKTSTLGLTGKNYFGNWTVSYDYSKQINSGYTIPVTNPSILSAYIERRFLPQNRATIRLAAVDLFNQNTGFSVQSDANSVSQTSVNRLGRYYMLTFSLRLQKFAGRAPTQEGERGGPGGGDRNRGGGREGGGGDRQRGGGGFGGGGNGGGGFGGGE